MVAPSQNFAALLAEPWRLKKTGFLSVSVADLRTVIAFLDGTPIAANGGSAATEITRLAVRDQLLTEAQRQQAMMLMRDLAAKGVRPPVLKVLIQMGALDPETANRVLAAQVEERILECFRHERVTALFQEEDAAVRRLPNQHPCPVPQLILEGMLHHFDESQIQALLAPHLEKRVHLEDRSIAAEPFEVPPEMLSFLDSDLPLDALVVDASDLERCLAAALIVTGIMGFEDRPQVLPPEFLIEITVSSGSGSIDFDSFDLPSVDLGV